MVRNMLETSKNETKYRDQGITNDYNQEDKELEGPRKREKNEKPKSENFTGSNLQVTNKKTAEQKTKLPKKITGKGQNYREIRKGL